jgi:hypothetical protein
VEGEVEGGTVSEGGEKKNLHLNRPGVQVNWRANIGSLLVYIFV